MLSKTKLMLSAPIMGLVGLIYLILMQDSIAGYLCIAQGFMFLFLSSCVVPIALPRQHVKFLFEMMRQGCPTILEWEDFKKIYGEDREFAHTVNYMVRMSPEELLRFTRAVVELRYQMDQSTLSSVGDYLRGRW